MLIANTNDGTINSTNYEAVRCLSCQLLFLLQKPVTFKVEKKSHQF